MLYRSAEQSGWAMLQEAKGFWYADPFLFTHEGRTYLFTEGFDRKKQIGRIAVSVMKDGRFSVPQIIIENEYHMSYPCVFSYKGKIYMIPETSEGRTLELYEAVKFPFVWKREVIQSSIMRVDTTVLVREDQIYLIAYNERDNISELYRLDMETKHLELLFQKQHSEKKYRPGGQFIENGAELYRPVQDCTQLYGGKLIFLKTENLFCLDEDAIHELGPGPISKDYQRLHTYNKCAGFETVDVFEDMTGWKCFAAKVKRKLHRLKMRKQYDRKEADTETARRYP